MLAIENLFRVRIQQCPYCNRFLVDNVLYHSETNRRLKKRNNSVVELADGTLCKILSIVAFNLVGGDAKMNCVLVKELCRSGRQLCRDSDLKNFFWVYSRGDGVELHLCCAYAVFQKKMCDGRFEGENVSLFCQIILRGTELHDCRCPAMENFQFAWVIYG